MKHLDAFSAPAIILARLQLLGDPPRMVDAGRAFICSAMLAFFRLTSHWLLATVAPAASDFDALLSRIPCAGVDALHTPHVLSLLAEVH